jgi:hypothetical protein
MIRRSGHRHGVGLELALSLENAVENLTVASRRLVLGIDSAYRFNPRVVLCEQTLLSLTTCSPKSSCILDGSDEGTIRVDLACEGSVDW